MTKKFFIKADINNISSSTYNSKFIDFFERNFADISFEFSPCQEADLYSYLYFNNKPHECPKFMPGNTARLVMERLLTAGYNYKVYDFIENQREYIHHIKKRYGDNIFINSKMSVALNQQQSKKVKEIISWYDCIEQKLMNNLYNIIVNSRNHGKRPTSYSDMTIYFKKNKTIEIETDIHDDIEVRELSTVILKLISAVSVSSVLREILSDGYYIYKYSDDLNKILSNYKKNDLYDGLLKYEDIYIISANELSSLLQTDYINYVNVQASELKTNHNRVSSYINGISDWSVTDAHSGTEATVNIKKEILNPYDTKSVNNDKNRWLKSFKKMFSL